jgi:small subunit ribosomal protein S16
MPTKLRLQRHGKKGKPFFHVVAADARAKRDGKFIEKLGIYNPNTNPATIEIDFEKTLEWIKTGAVPTDTVRALLSYKGVIYKNHLDKGVLKGAHTQAQADAKFDKWLNEKESNIQGKADGLSKAADDNAKSRTAAEKEINDTRAKAIAAKNSELADALAAANAPAPVEAVAEETTATEEAAAPAKEEKSAE